ncbi:MAG: EamA family transporter [Terriglobales bacterium]
MKVLYTWGAIALLVVASTAGDVVLSVAMKKIGDLGELRRQHGLGAVAKRIFTQGLFWTGIACMTVAFFSLLVALSWADVSLVAPAATSLTFLTTALAAKLFLNENVDRRRWLSALLVGAGVALLAW